MVKNEARREESRNFIIIITIFIGRFLHVGAGFRTSSHVEHAIENFIESQLAHLLQAYEFPVERSNTEIELKPRYGGSLPAFSLHFYNTGLDAHGENTRCDRSPLRWLRCSSEITRSYPWLFHAVSFGVIRIQWPDVQETFRRAQFRSLPWPFGRVSFSRATRADWSDSEFFFCEETNSAFKRQSERRVPTSYLIFYEKRRSRFIVSWISSRELFRWSYFDVRRIRDVTLTITVDWSRCR